MSSRNRMESDEEGESFNRRMEQAIAESIRDFESSQNPAIIQLRLQRNQAEREETEQAKHQSLQQSLDEFRAEFRREVAEQREMKEATQLSLRELHAPNRGPEPSLDAVEHDDLARAIQESRYESEARNRERTGGIARCRVPNAMRRREVRARGQTGPSAPYRAPRQDEPGQPSE